jgi:hypothetical protein
MGNAPENERSADSAQRKTDNDIAPVVGPVAITAPQPPPSQPKNHCTDKKRRWTKDPPMFWITLAGVIAVVAYTSVAAWQACLSNKQLTEMRRVYGPIRDQANAARDSVEAVKVQLRAYISFDQGSISDATGATPPIISLEIKNTGLTPAYDLIWLSTFAAVPFPKYPPIVIDRKSAASKSTLAPGATTSRSQTIQGWNQDWGAGIAKGTAAIFIIGEISFTDAFNCTNLIHYRFMHGGNIGVRPNKLTLTPDGNEEEPPNCPKK